MYFKKVLYLIFWIFYNYEKELIHMPNYTYNASDENDVSYLYEDNSDCYDMDCFDDNDI